MKKAGRVTTRLQLALFEKKSKKPIYLLARVYFRKSDK
jgi:hypothetical protein